MSGLQVTKCTELYREMVAEELRVLRLSMSMSTILYSDHISEAHLLFHSLLNFYE